MTIRRFFELLSGSYLVLSAALLVVVACLFVNQRNLELSQRARFQSYLLADELRQSSDDLTRFARTYVVTGEARYERYYYDVLAIRNGDKPRPAYYHRIYWDLVAGEHRIPRADVGAVPLHELMLRAGVTDEELELLEEAQAKSDSLVRVEEAAMQAVKGLYADSRGRFTHSGPRNQSLAVRLTHNETYHRLKAGVMRPLDLFLGLIDDRTARATATFQRRGDRYLVLSGVLVAALLGLTLLSLGMFRRRIYEPVQALRNQTYMLAADVDRLAGVTAGIADGDLSQRFVPKTGRLHMSGEDEVARLARLHDAMIVQIEQAGAAISRVTAALQESEARYRELVDSQSEGIAIVDASERFLFANPAATGIFGVRDGTLGGRNLRDFTDEEQMQIVRRETEARRQGRRSTYELEITRPDRTRRSLRVTATPKFGSDARWAGTLTVFADITDQKRAEAALQESEEKYRNLVERANDGIVIIQDELIAFANRRFAALAGRSVKAITGIPFLDCIHPDEREKVEGYYRARLAGSTVPATYETSLSRIGGGRLPVEMNAGVITYRGKPADLKIVRDISARKEAEEEIHAKSVRLEFLNRTLDQERVQLLDLTRQLTLANEELKRLSEAKSEFVASVSHDLRTPLTTIISGVAMVEQGTLGRVNAEQRKFLRYALEDAERLADLIGDILDVAKIEAGKITVNPTCVNVEQHVARVRESHAGYAGEKELTLTCRVAGPLPSVRCDAEHYTRILANLLSNAVKYTPPKGTITLSATADADGWVTTSVADTGVGIPLEEQARVFGRFEQIRRDGFFPQPGSGLGLALCKQLVELNGGTIGFTSRENEGSTFYFRLPPCAEDEDKPKC